MIGKIIDCITFIILTWLIYFIYVFILHFLLSGYDLQNTINWFQESFFLLPIFSVVILLSDFSDQSNKSLLNSVKAQVNAAEIANEGIVAEYNSGSDRTTLEVIQSNSLLLNAQISLADSERNYILSQFNLLKSVGLLNSDYLKIK